MPPPPEVRRGPDANPGLSQSIHHHAEASSTVHGTADVGLLELSDERDRQLNRLLAAERDAYHRGYADGRADACVALAEMEEHWAEIAWWRQYAAKVRRIVLAETDPS